MKDQLIHFLKVQQPKFTLHLGLLDNYDYLTPDDHNLLVQLEQDQSYALAMRLVRWFEESDFYKH